MPCAPSIEPWSTPALALLAAFLVVPAVYVTWLSAHTSIYGQDARFVGWANYANTLKKWDSKG